MNVNRDLRQLLTDSFNKEELKSLSFDLGIDYENLPEQKDALARELIVTCERLGLLGNLVDECRKQRPGVDWPVIEQSLSLEELLGEKAPLLPYEPQTIAVPAGSFLMGSLEGQDVPASEQPQHECQLDFFRIGKYPITNAQYAAFIKAQPQQAVPRKAGWFLRQPPADRLELPVVGISWFEAQAYCLWLNAQTGKHYRLPFEAEWEKAARGSAGLIYPWGNDWEQDLCNHGNDQISSVDAYPLGISPYGCFDMLGNVQEWTNTLWGDDRRNPTCYPYDPGDERENPANDPQRPRLRRIHRGGSFKSELRRLRCAARDHDRPASASLLRGFRIVLAPG